MRRLSYHVEEGEKFGHLTVRTVVEGRSECLCDCDCGAERVQARPDKLRRGQKITCGRTCPLETRRWRRREEDRPHLERVVALRKEGKKPAEIMDEMGIGYEVYRSLVRRAVDWGLTERAPTVAAAKSERPAYEKLCRTIAADENLTLPPRMRAFIRHQATPADIALLDPRTRATAKFLGLLR